MQTNIQLDWADGKYDFKLTWPAMAEIERKSDTGIQAIYERMMIGGAHLTDISGIIRQGLHGGDGGIVDGQPVELNAPQIEALVERYVTGPDKLPVLDNWNVAKVVLHTAMVGYQPAIDEAAKKKTESSSPPATGSTSEAS